MLLTVILAASTLNLTILGFFWNSMSNRFDQIAHRIDKLDEKLTDVDRRLCRMEGAFASKDCCMIKDERQMKKAE